MAVAGVIIRWARIWAVSFALWILFEDSTSVPELLIGGGVAAITAGLLLWSAGRLHLPPLPMAAALAVSARMLKTTIADYVQITRAVGAALRGAVSGEVRDLPPEERVDAATTEIACGLRSMTPNSVAFGQQMHRLRIRKGR